MRRGMGIGTGMRGYYNLVPLDHHIHSLSARGVKTYNPKYMWTDNYSKKRYIVPDKLYLMRHDIRDDGDEIFDEIVRPLNEKKDTLKLRRKYSYFYKEDNTYTNVYVASGKEILEKIDSGEITLSAKEQYPVNLPIKEVNLTFSDGSRREIPYITELMRPMAITELPDKDYNYEIKKDGALSLAYFDKGEVGFINRRGNEKTMVYPELTDKEPKDIKIKGMTILQGEIMTEDGTLKSFQNLLKRDLVQSRDKARDRMEQYPLKFYVFDVLMKDGKWVTDEPFEKRHQIVEDLITKDLKDYEVAKELPYDKAYFEKLHKGKVYEGIVAKKKGSPYVSGKTPFWFKKKFVTQADTVVLGYEKGQGRRSEIGKILVGVFNPTTERIEQVAKVGTGFTDAQLSEVKQRVDRGEKLFATVEYLNRTKDNHLRNPSFVGLRADIVEKDTHF